jgi:hypothetical protein
MPVQLTISVERPSLEEADAALREEIQAYLARPPLESQSGDFAHTRYGQAPAAPPPLPGWRSIEEIERWFEQWQPMAQEIVRFIVSDPPQLEFDSIERHFKLSGKIISGHMSSPGHVITRLFGRDGRPHPIGRDYNRRRYTLSDQAIDVLRYVANRRVVGERGLLNSRPNRHRL